MLRLLVVGLGLVFAGPAFAFNEAYDAAATRIQEARSQKANAAAHRDMAAAARASGTEEGRFVSYVIRSEALARGSGHAVNNLGAGLTAPGALTSSVAYAEALGPLLLEINEAFDMGAYDVDATVRLGEALLKLEETAKKNGLPGMSDILNDMLGDSSAGARAQILLKSLIGIGQSVKGGASATALSKEAIKAQRDAFLDLFPSSIMPYAPIVPLVRDQIQWTADLFDGSSRAMDIVTAAIRSGTFDAAAFAQVENDMITLFSRGPFGTETFKDVMLGWCKTIPELGKYCSDIWREMKYAINSKMCRAVACDCDNVQKSFHWIYRAECLKHELQARLECAVAKKVVMGCLHPHGPAAFVLK